MNQRHAAELLAYGGRSAGKEKLRQRQQTQAEAANPGRGLARVSSCGVASLRHSTGQSWVLPTVALGLGGGPWSW